MTTDTTGRHNARTGNRSIALESRPTRFVTTTPDGPGHTVVHLEHADGSRERLPRYRGVVNHSRGFGWGYGGSGPAQLAAAMVAEVFDPATAREHYQAVKANLVARQPRDAPLSISVDEVRQLVRTLETAPPEVTG